MDWLLGVGVNNSVAFLGLASLLIPIIIHLINPSKGVIVLIGNLNLIKNTKKTTQINYQVTQKLLLILRLIILTLITFILSDVYKKNSNLPIEETKVFVSVDWLNNATPDEKNELKKSYSPNQIFLLGVASTNQSLADFNFFEDEYLINNPNLSIQTQLIEFYEHNLLSKQNIIYTTNRKNEFIENLTLPFLNKIEWEIKELPKNLISNLQINIALYFSSSRAIDHQYLLAALESASKITNYQINISSFDLDKIDNINQFDTNSNPHWIFWLSDIQPPTLIEDLISQGGNILYDYKNEQNIKLKENSIKTTQIQYYHSLPNSVKISDKIEWRLSSEEISLSSRKQGLGKVFSFYSRFNPNWNTLTGDFRFPLTLTKLLDSSLIIKNSFQISNSEINSISPQNNQSLIEPLTPKQYYREILILILCSFWLLERFFSERKESNK